MTEGKGDVLYLQVKSIADKIVLTGEEPRPETVYELLGEIGTKEQITEYLQRWREERENDIAKNKGIANLSLQTADQFTEDRANELKKSLALVRSTLESTADGILVIDNRGRLVDWNQKFIEMAKIPKEILEKGKEREGLRHMLTQVQKPWELIKLMLRLQFNRAATGEVGEVLMKDGRIVERYSQPHRVDGKIVGRVWSFRDVTEQRKAEESLRLRQRAIESSTHGVIIADCTPELNILYVNPAFSRITGYKDSQVLGKSFDFLYKDDLNQPEIQKIKQAIQRYRKETVVVRCYRNDGTMFWNEMNISPVPDAKGTITHYVCNVSDITERKAMEEQLLHQATHDLLTELPNRLLLLDRLQQSIQLARRDHTLVVVFFLDLDRFKLVNDSLGHKMGDELLRMVARRIKNIIRPTDTVARIGGDEFVVALPQIKRIEESIGIAQKILDEIRESFLIEERELHITASLGITYYPKDGLDSDTLLRNADTAMYLAKDSGRDNFQFFTDELNRLVTKRLTLGSYLHKAIEQNELQVVYQPIFELTTEKVAAFEALLRWNCKAMGSISPIEFIPLAEETGLIIPIGDWVMKTACTQLMQWHQRGANHLQMAINVSSRQLLDKHFIESVKNTINIPGLNPGLIVIEITESVFLGNAEDNIDKLQELRNMGLKLSIDDFGTGYSSLSYLRRFPIDKLKIDRAFINEITTDPSSEAISLAIITLCKSLNIKTVAEGVETLQQLEMLREFQCDEIQGFYFSKPLNVADSVQLLQKNLGLK